MLHGVASKANLVMVKFANAMINDTSGGLEPMAVTPDALYDAWDWVIDDVAEQRKSGNNGKFVTCMSYCEARSTHLKDPRTNRWRRLRSDPV